MAVVLSRVDFEAERGIQELPVYTITKEGRKLEKELGNIKERVIKEDNKNIRVSNNINPVIINNIINTLQ